MRGAHRGRERFEYQLFFISVGRLSTGQRQWSSAGPVRSADWLSHSQTGGIPNKICVCFSSKHIVGTKLSVWLLQAIAETAIISLWFPPIPLKHHLLIGTRRCLTLAPA